MSRVAKWRRAANEPTTVLGWLYRNDLKPFRIDRREAIRFLIVASFLIGIAALVCRAHPRASGALGPMVVGGTSFIFEKTKRRRRANPKDPPEPADAFNVRITIRDAHGIRTGSDGGWLIFSEGWVLFEGARTEFAVTRGESYRRSHEPTLSLKLEDGRTVEFVSAGVPPTPRPLNRAFTAWETMTIPDGTAVLPPRETHPEVWVERHALCVVGVLLSIASIGLGIALRLAFIDVIGFVTGSTCLWAGRRYVQRLGAALSGGAPPLPRDARGSAGR